MRCDLRETGYLEEPYEKKALLSIDGEPLHEDLNSFLDCSKKEEKQISLMHTGLMILQWRTMQNRS